MDIHRRYSQTCGQTARRGRYATPSIPAFDMSKRSKRACAAKCVCAWLRGRVAACVCACVHACMRPCMGVSVHAWVRASVRPCMRGTCIQASVHAMCPCMHASKHSCMHASVCPCIHACGIPVGATMAALTKARAPTFCFFHLLSPWHAAVGT